MLPVFQKALDQLKEQVGYAGGAFVAIKDGKVIIKETFGVADAETQEPVTEDMLFSIASDTKCMTTSIISQLVDEGKCSWDDPVRKHYPEFFLENEAISEMMTLKDFASHRSGICSQNLVRSTPPELLPTRESYVKRMKYLKMSKPFRDTFQYQNDYYVMLGYIAERITGKSYEELVTERIGKRLGMTIGFRGLPLPEGAVSVRPHNMKNKEAIPAGFDPFWQSNPCGGARISLNSAEKWVRMWASGGMLPDGSRFISEDMFNLMTKPIMFWSDPGRDGAADRNRCYALGLAPSTFRGHKQVYHGGSINGFRSAMGFYPGLNSGWFIMTNCDCQPMAYLKIMLGDAVLGILKDDYTEEIQRSINSYYAPKKELPAPIPVSDEEKSKFYGTWENGLYGKITISDGGPDQILMTYYKLDMEIPLRSILPTGEYCFQRKTYQTYDLRFSPDGQELTFSFSEFYTANKFTRVKE